MQQVIDRMLELSSLENRKEPLQKEAVAVQSLLSNLLESAQPLLEQKQLRLVMPSRTTDIVQADPFLLNRALNNLLTNAMEFSPSGGTIEIRLDLFPGSLTFLFLDQGPGIPDYAENKIFEKFYSLERPGTGKKSTGLGLSFVHQVARLHDGEVRLDNRKHGGACARFTIPANLS